MAIILSFPLKLCSKPSQTKNIEKLTKAEEPIAQTEWPWSKNIKHAENTYNLLAIKSQQVSRLQQAQRILESSEVKKHGGKKHQTWTASLCRFSFNLTMI